MTRRPAILAASIAALACAANAACNPRVEETECDSYVEESCDVTPPSASGVKATADCGRFSFELQGVGKGSEKILRTRHWFGTGNCPPDETTKKESELDAVVSWTITAGEESRSGSGTKAEMPRPTGVCTASCTFAVTVSPKKCSPPAPVEKTGTAVFENAVSINGGGPRVCTTSESHSAHRFPYTVACAANKKAEVTENAEIASDDGAAVVVRGKAAGDAAVTVSADCGSDEKSFDVVELDRLTLHGCGCIDGDDPAFETMEGTGEVTATLTTTPAQYSDETHTYLEYDETNGIHTACGWFDCDRDGVEDPDEPRTNRTYEISRIGELSAFHRFQFECPDNCKDVFVSGETVLFKNTESLPEDRQHRLEIISMSSENEDCQMTLQVGEVQPSGINEWTIKIPVDCGTGEFEIALSDPLHSCQRIVFRYYVRKVIIEHILLWETANKANQIFNPTPKDDYTGNSAVREEEVAADGRYLIYGVPRNNLYVVADEYDNTFNVTEKLKVFPEGVSENVLCAAFVAGTVVEGSETRLNEGSEAVMRIPSPDPAETVTYEIRAGVDFDADGMLSWAESQPLKIYEHKGQSRYATVKGITNAQYDDCEGEIEGMVVFKRFLYEDNPPDSLLPLSRSFLSLFYDAVQNNISQDLRPTDTIEVPLAAFADNKGFAEWLTHNAGADFDDGGNASITKYIWGPDSRVAREVAKRSPFAPWMYDGRDPNFMTEVWIETDAGRALMAYYDANLKSVAESMLVDAECGERVMLPIGGWCSAADIGNVFTSMSPAWVAGATNAVTLAIGHADWYDGKLGAYSTVLKTLLKLGGSDLDEYDAFGAIGRGRVTDLKYRFCVEKHNPLLAVSPQYRVVSIEYSCVISDLYDFNYEDGEFSRYAAGLQVGNSGTMESNSERRKHGHIYRHEIQIEATCNNPFR